jgi:phosphoserine phosphatase
MFTRWTGEHLVLRFMNSNQEVFLNAEETKEFEQWVKSRVAKERGLSRESFNNVVESARRFNTGSLADKWAYRFEKLVEWLKDEYDIAEVQ